MGGNVFHEVVKCKGTGEKSWRRVELMNALGINITRGLLFRDRGNNLLGVS